MRELSKGRNPLKVVGALLLTGLVLYTLISVFLWFMVWFPIPYELTPITFDSQAWADARCGNKYDRTRHRMLDDLKSQLMGKTKEEVVTLLGEPDPYGQYCVGGEPVLFPIDTEWMEPVYGADGHVETIDFYYN